MITPTYLSNTTNKLADVYEEIQKELITDMINRLQEAEDLSQNSSNEQYIEALSIVGNSYQKVEKEVNNSLENAVILSIRQEKHIYKLAYEKGLVETYKINNDLFNFIAQNNSEAVMNYMLEINRNITTSSNLLFKDLMQQAYRDVISGVHIESSIENAINNLAKNGIKLINYKNSNWNIDTAVRNVLSTAINKTVSEVNLSMINEMGANLVQVTSHYDARETHAVWQGGIYWINKPFKNHKNFYDVTGYGTSSGLGGWNCRHTFFAYFPELSQDNYIKERASYDDELYKLTQIQRYNERMIREWKRRRDIRGYANYPNDKEIRKVKEWQKRQRDLIKENKNLYRYYQREQVFN